MPPFCSSWSRWKFFNKARGISKRRQRTPGLLERAPRSVLVLVSAIAIEGVTPPLNGGW